MIEILKAPTIEEIELANKKMNEDSEKYLPDFLRNVFEEINFFIQRQNFIEYKSPTIEFQWKWYDEFWKDKIRKSVLYGKALTEIKEALDKAGWHVFYSGGGDRVYYFTITPKEMNYK